MSRSFLKRLYSDEEMWKRRDVKDDFNPDGKDSPLATVYKLEQKLENVDRADLTYSTRYGNNWYVRGRLNEDHNFSPPFVRLKVQMQTDGTIYRLNVLFVHDDDIAKLGDMVNVDFRKRDEAIQKSKTNLERVLDEKVASKRNIVKEMIDYEPNNTCYAAVLEQIMDVTPEELVKIIKRCETGIFTGDVQYAIERHYEVKKEEQKNRAEWEKTNRRVIATFVDTGYVQVDNVQRGGNGKPRELVHDEPLMPEEKSIVFPMISAVLDTLPVLDPPFRAREYYQEKFRKFTQTPHSPTSSRSK